MHKILICILSSLFISSGVYATDISWINGLDKPEAWTIDPPEPGQGDMISFSGPVGPITNSCFAKIYLGGTPAISIDDASKVVELWFQGPAPQTCPFTWAPVCGLTGQFGPLSPGEWTFKCTQPSIAFEIHFIVTGPPAPVGKFYYVDMDTPGSVHDGKSWNHAFKYLQDALAIATGGDTVYVAQGTYKPDKGGLQTLGDRMATFSPAPGVTLIGSCAGYGHTDPNRQNVKTYTTTLSGDLSSNDIWGVLNRQDNSYQVVRVAGGMSAMVTINGFVITAGQADGPDLANSGAGLDIDGSNVMLVNTTITGNTSGFGGGISCKNAKLSMWNCKINGNNAAIYGGGLYSYASDVEMANCLMTGNAASQAKTTGGSAIHNLGGNIHISDCTIADNSISTKSAEGNAIVSYAWKTPADCNLVIANSILFNGGNEILTNLSSAVTVSYCDVQGGFTGTGNINKTPLFTNPGQRDAQGKWADGDYTLKSNSPCNNKGKNSLIAKDIPDLDNDGNVNEQLPIDLDGNARIKDSTVDMGAYEQPATFTPEPPQPVLDDGVWYYVPYYIYGNPNVTLQSAPVTYTINLNFQATVSFDILPTSAAGGKWSAWFSPDPGVVGPGTVTVTLVIRGENVNISKLPPGYQKIATLSIFVQPTGNVVQPGDDDNIPPDDGGITPPDDNIPPPDDGGITPPDDNIPPDDGGITPPDDNIPPDDGGITPPDDNIPPDDGGITPPDDNIPPDDGGITPPDDNIPPDDGGGTPPDDNIPPDIIPPDDNIIT